MKYKKRNQRKEQAEKVLELLQHVRQWNKHRPEGGAVHYFSLHGLPSHYLVAAKYLGLLEKTEGNKYTWTGGEPNMWTAKRITNSACEYRYNRKLFGKEQPTVAPMKAQTKLDLPAPPAPIKREEGAVVKKAAPPVNNTPKSVKFTVKLFGITIYSTSKTTEK